MEARLINVSASLVARPADLAYAEALADFVQRNNDHLRRYLPAVSAIDSLDKARLHLAEAAGRAARNEVLEWYLFANGDLCGAIRLNKIETLNRKVSIAYLLGADYQGRGFATLCVRTFLRHCFDDLGMNRVELTCATDNLRSVGVAERAGFVREGVLRQAEWLDGKAVDHYVYGILRSDFLSA